MSPLRLDEDDSEGREDGGRSGPEEGTIRRGLAGWGEVEESEIGGIRDIDKGSLPKTKNFLGIMANTVGNTTSPWTTPNMTTKKMVRTKTVGV